MNKPENGWIFIRDVNGDHVMSMKIEEIDDFLGNLVIRGNEQEEIKFILPPNELQKLFKVVNKLTGRR